MKIHHILCGVLASLMFALCSCNSEEVPVAVPSNESSGVSLSIACVSKGAISRATFPDLEFGRENENTIDDALIIIYDQPLNSGSGTVQKIISLSNLTDSTAIAGNRTAGLYWYNSSGTQQTIYSLNKIIARRYDINNSESLAAEILALGEGRTLYAVALANISLSDLSGLAVGTSVSALRDMVYTGPLCTGPVSTTGNGANSVTSSSHFAMTAINEVKFSTTFDQNDHLTIPTLMVQRLAARIDVSFGDQAPNGAESNKHISDKNTTLNRLYDVEVLPSGKFRFPVYDEDAYQAEMAKTSGRIEANLNKRLENIYFDLSGITILNPVSSGTYLFEHSSGSPAYLGNEGTWTSGHPANFISSPATGRSIADRVLTSASVSPVTVVNNAIGSKSASFTFDPDDLCSIFSTLGYVGENTYPLDNGGKIKSFTGLKLQGTTNLKTIADDTLDDEIAMEASIIFRHSFGAVDSSNPLTYGVVRNTIYRVYLRFFASKESLVVRWYHYSGSNNALTEDAYSVSFNPYIHENPLGPTND